MTASKSICVFSCIDQSKCLVWDQTIILLQISLHPEKGLMALPNNSNLSRYVNRYSELCFIV